MKKVTLVLIFFFNSILGNASFFTPYSFEEIIYGTDDRIEIHKLKIPELKSQASSVSGLFWNHQIARVDDYYTYSKESLADLYPMCQQEKYVNDYTLPHCSGFLVARDIILTAAHCFFDFTQERTPQEICQKKSWIFDYTSNLDQLDPKNIFQCEEVIAINNDPSLDYAFIKINRKTNRQIFSLQTWLPQIGTPIHGFGHGSYTPLKYYGKAKIVSYTSENMIRSNIDTYEGNSGMPIFNSNNNSVIGVLSRGGKDYNFDNERSCLHSNMVKDIDENAEEIISPIKNILEDLLSNNYEASLRIFSSQ